MDKNLNCAASINETWSCAEIFLQIWIYEMSEKKVRESCLSWCDDDSITEAQVRRNMYLHLFKATICLCWDVWVWSVTSSQWYPVAQDAPTGPSLRLGAGPIHSHVSAGFYPPFMFCLAYAWTPLPWHFPLHNPLHPPPHPACSRCPKRG